MWIDCHSHLHVRDFDADREETIQRARAAGVGKFINVGFDVEGNFQAIALAKKHDFVYATMGVHPHGASEWNDHVGQQIFKTAKFESKVVALGEMGLDYFKNLQPKELQKTVFIAQLQLAKELDLPVIIHCRDAFVDTFKILAKEKMERVLLHCFTGTLEEAREGWKRGYFTAFTGILTYPSAVQLREIAKECPANQLLIETDCPYLAPQSHRGERNEPAFLADIGVSLASLRNVDEIFLQTQLEKNVQELFGIV